MFSLVMRYVVLCFTVLGFTQPTPELLVMIIPVP
jgi:hypothetical protein